MGKRGKEGGREGGRERWRERKYTSKVIGDRYPRIDRRSRYNTQHGRFG